jgi:predicted DNA-binding protein YlxM (UPF0122 family)
MDKTLYLTNLYDYYGELLTVKEKKYFQEYYFKNFSLSEISDNTQVSKAAISKEIKQAEKKLLNFEAILKEYEKSIKIKKIIKNLDETTKNKIEELL